MEDEKYLFITDCKEKKRVARSVHNRRTHAGKGGRVKFPSDYMTKKERESMNGEVVAYRLNEPMKWIEFLAQPDDIQVLYIKAIRNKFGVSDRAIGEMLGANKDAVSRHFKKLGIAVGEKRGNKNWNKEAWQAWLRGVPYDAEEAESPMEVEAEEEPANASLEMVGEFKPAVQVLPVREECKTVPVSGTMVFKCAAKEAFETMSCLLGDSKFTLEIKWNGCED